MAISINKISEDIQKQIIDDYKNNTSLRKLEEKYNVSRSTISSFLEKKGIKTQKGNHYRKYFHNEDFFEKIDSEEKAYWLGFLTADGWINKNEKGNAGVTGIELQYKDIDHLRKFNKSINGNYKITDRWRPCLISSKYNNKRHHTCLIRIFSITMYDSLVKLGFTNNKSGFPFISFTFFISEVPVSLSTFTFSLFSIQRICS